MDFTPMVEYGETARRFSWQLPKTFNFGRDVVDRWAAAADKEALIWCDEAGEERRYSFSDVSGASSRLANLLVRQGVRKGDRVIVMLPRIPQWQISMVACLKVGAIPIPCVEMLTARDIGYRLNHSGAAAAITTPPNAGKFPESAPLAARIVVGEGFGRWVSSDEASRESSHFDCADLEIDEPAVLYYTSGSSGNPKGVLHATRALFAWRLSAAYWHSLGANDVQWCTADTGWSKAGTAILFGPWSMGATVLFYNGRFDPEQRLRLLARHKVTVFCAAATEFRHLVNAPVDRYDLRSLRLSVSAGEAVNPEVVRRWRELTGVALLEGYGQTETLMTILNYPCMEIRAGSMGKPIPGTEFEIVTDGDTAAATGAIGQLAMKLPNVQFMLGYWNDPETTRNAIATLGGHRYWLTGDLGYRDADGYFFYAGRADDIICSAGYSIGPAEVENALLEHAAVLESAVVAAPDPERGQVVKAFVMLRPQFAPSEALIAELQDHVKRTTAPYKYPRRIEFVDELPKSATGKLLRRVLREREYETARMASCVRERP